VYPGSVVAPRRKIGDAAVVGAGSAVFVDVDPCVTVLGNPARPID
jgi:acetyltransferase-like isoleucine patch superfamily enzyme